MKQTSCGTGPAPEYIAAVLSVNFEDAKRYFLSALIDIHYAHTLMLARQKILKPGEAARCLRVIGSLDREKLATALYDGSCEDFFFFVEKQLESLDDPEVIGKIHTARSRNDIDMTLYRMNFRREILQFANEQLTLRRVLLHMASAHLDTVMPAYTHTQPAQPSTLAHYMLAAAEFLGRDIARLRAAFAVLNCSPLGACAITTTGFPIDRGYTAELLGFEGLQENSYGAIASVDAFTQAASAVAVAMVSLGRFTQDMLLWCTREFGFLHVDDGYVQISSIMPQKRNPVSFEHVRILASKAFSQAQGVLGAVHNTPFADMVDSEDDLQPLLFHMFEDAHRATTLLAAVMAHCHVNREHLREQAGRNFLTVTELADTLVREEGISFRAAHQLVSGAVRQAGLNDDPGHLISLVRKLAPCVVGKELVTLDAVLIRALDPENFIRVRSIVGGPAPVATRAAVNAMLQDCTEGEVWVKEKNDLLRDYPERLRQAAESWLRI